MQLFKIILPFICITRLVLFSKNETPLVDSDRDKVQNNYCGFFINKKSEPVLQARYSLELNCDSTFLYRYTSCTLNSISSGKWKVLDNKIYLFTDKETFKRINKNPKNKFSKTYVDLTGTILISQDSFMIWKFQNELLDTLQRSIPPIE